jgi:tRNA U34 2-thiouridine synthase MnmA/TrmU
MLATGHYARLLHSQDGSAVQLLRRVDWDKDQSYFLASVVSCKLICIETLAPFFNNCEGLKLLT